MRTLLLVFLLPALAAGCSQGDGETVALPPAPPPVTASPPPPQSPVAPPRRNGLPADLTGFARGGPRAATGLSSEARCEQTSRRRAVADLSWEPARQQGNEQRIVIAIDEGQFANGAFDAGKPLPPSASTFLWTRVRGASIHTWQVLTRHGDTWTASRPARFEGELCEADFQNPAPPPPTSLPGSGPAP